MSWEPIKPVRAALARRVRDIVVGHFPAYTRDGNGALVHERELPVLHAPNTGWGEHWVLSWEGATTGTPYSWPCLVTGGGVEEYTGQAIEPAGFPPEVFCEPINAVELGIYPPH